jgi:D-alanyl-D-alanine carboxypeptidase (penicillin-binding protein 5/6)
MAHEKAMRSPGLNVVSAVAAVAFALAMFVAPSAAQVRFESAAPHAMLVDFETGTVLYEKGADEAIIPASMLKLMTLEVLFEELRTGRLKLTDQFTVSVNAWRTGGAPSGGSAMMLTPNARPTVEDLIRGIVVVSGNDAAITVAEAISGTEEKFAVLMNERARIRGLAGSTFVNSTGFDAEGQRMTVRDIIKLADILIRDYPQYYKYFAEREFSWNNRAQQNRNPLLTMEGLGADGLKTGYLKVSGYGVIGSAVQNGRRLIVVVHGLEEARDRGQEARKLLEWGFRTFEERTLFAAGEEIAEIEVFGGETARVPVAAPSAVTLLLPRGELGRLQVEIVYRGPRPAPIAKGETIGEVQVSRAGAVLHRAQVAAARDVPVGSITRRATDAAWALVVDGVRAAFASLTSRT